MPDTKLRLPLGVVGWTVYTRLKTESGLIWNSTTSAYVAYVLANIADFKLATPETPAGSGDYEATMPTGSAAGNYSWSHYRLIGANPAASDPLVGSGGNYWDGTGFGASVVASLPSPAPLTYGPVGTGSRVVNQDYPTADNLSFKTTLGVGIGGALVRAYLTSEYTANPNTATVRGQTLTLDSGAWANVIDLDPAAYTLTFKAEGYELAVATVTVS